MVGEESVRTRVSTAARYRRLAAIGHGGMADVYLAAARGVGGTLKLLVLKELRPALARDPEYRAMFQREARIAALLSHPNAVQVYEVGSEEGRPFLAMEYLEGQPLHRVLRRLHRPPPGPRELPLAMHLRIVAELLAGLHYAHELRDLDGRPLALVHRDVTPHNVLVTYDGQVKLVDFGIARIGDDGDTQVGTFKGKAAYASPEQVRGAQLDRRSDLFSVGVMLWEALARQRMWHGLDELAIARRLEAGDVPPLPAEVRTSPALRALVAAALSPDPEGRPATAEAMREALEGSLGDLGPAAPRAIGALVAAAFVDDREALRCVVEQQIKRVRGAGEDPVPVDMSEETCFEDQASGAASDPDEHTRPDGLPGVESTADPHRAHPRERQEATWTGVAAPALPPRAPRALWPGWLAGGAIGAVAMWLAFQAGSGEPVPADRPIAGADGDACARADRPLVELSGEIERAARLTCDRRYRLRGVVFVRPGASLTIEPGTTIVGDRETRGTLVVQPGGRVFAEGSPARPIVFTSEAPAGERRAGDWGGVLLLGRAPINLRAAAGARVEGLAGGGEFGGDDPEDSSGALRYVRVEYAGVELAPNNETNGLTLAGVGRGTVIDHVQVRRPVDDCFEFFGGTVDARHLVCQDPGDDAFDWDLGYTGRLQFLLLRDGADASATSVGLEGDGGAPGALPRSAPTIANATLCGRGHPLAREHYGALLRTGTAATLGNLVMMGFEAPLDVRDRGGSLALFGGLWLARSFAAPLAFAEVRGGHGPLADDDGGLDEARLLAAAGARTDDVDLPGCADAGGSGRYKPLAPLAEGAAAPPDDGFFDASAAWAGAFRDADDAWDAGWVVWADAPEGARKDR